MISAHVHRHWACFQIWALWVKLLWTCVCKPLYGYMLLVILGRFLGLGWLHMISACLHFYDSQTGLQCGWASRWRVPTSSTENAFLAHPPQCFSVLLVLVGVVLIVVVCVSLMSSDVAHLSYVHLPLLFPLWWCVQILYPFLIGLFYYWVLSSYCCICYYWVL